LQSNNQKTNRPGGSLLRAAFLLPKGHERKNIELTEEWKIDKKIKIKTNEIKTLA
jgi:hypothetical protein